MKLRADQQTQAFGLMKALPLFSGCSEEALKQLATEMEWRVVPIHRVLVMDQEINRTLYILAKGSVGIYKRISNERQRLATLEAPNFFGERSMFEESPASALVKAEEECMLFTLERGVFDTIAAKISPLTDMIQKNMEVVRAQRIVQPKPPENS